MRRFVIIALIIALLAPTAPIYAESATSTEIIENLTESPALFDEALEAEEAESIEISPQNLLLLVVFDDGSAALFLVESEEGVVPSGTMVQLLDYFPYGSMRVDWKSGSFDEARKFTGHEFDRSTNLTYMNARYYKQNIGRFLSQDPVFLQDTFNLADPQSLNAYSYSRNNPMRYIDPNGKAFMDYVNATGGYAVGLLQGAGTATVGFANAAFHPIQTAQNTGAFLASGVNAGQQLATDIFLNPSQTIGEISTGIGISYSEFASRSYYEQGKAIGNIFGQVEVGAAVSAGASKLAGGLEVKVTPQPKIGSAGGPGAGKIFSEEVKALSRESAGNTCVFCSRPTNLRSSNPLRSETDHAIPKARGGNNTIENAQNTCRDCNRQKGSMTTTEYINSRKEK